MLPTADFNHNDFQQGQEAEADKALLVRFFVKEKENKAATLKEGRPIFRDAEYIEVRVAGKRDPQICREARPHDINRFPEHYRRFKQRIAEPTEGTPLSQWPQIARSQAEELAFLNVKTVEQLAEMSDGNCMNFHGGLTLKRRAQEWLEEADTSKKVAEMDEMRELIKMQQEQIEQLKAMVADQVTAPAVAVEVAEAEPEPAPKPKRTRARRKTVKTE